MFLTLKWNIISRLQKPNTLHLNLPRWSGTMLVYIYIQQIPQDGTFISYI